MFYKEKIYNIFYGPQKNNWSLIVQNLVITLIILNIVAVTLESVEVIEHKYKSFFKAFDILSLFIFSLEYILRVWISNHGKETKVISRLKYIASPMALVDLLAVLPFFIFISNTSIDFRSLRVFRVLRILKFTRYSKTLNNLKNALKASQDELIISITLLFFMLIVSSTLIFFAEHNAQPETFSSIPASLWWSVITITTVGYGDVYPITVFGKIIAGVLAVSGIGLIAMPSGIFASELIFSAKKRKCSVCNATLNNSKK